jgi:hypothetical protein
MSLSFDSSSTAAVLTSFNDIRHDRDGNEETRDVVKDESSCRRVRVLESPPHSLSYVGQWRQVRVGLFRKVVVQQALGILALSISIFLIAAVTNHIGKNLIKISNNLLNTFNYKNLDLTPKNVSSSS